MAKSSRSKWKKAHRREKAAAEAKNVQKRVKQLNKKLKITIKGGISAVAPQAPEKRFHFLNPELDPRVPNTSAHLNNNYRAELNHVTYDYKKPLKLTPPKTNFYGKSDTVAPHPMTVNYETLDADAPVAGHALTKADMERIAMKQQELQALAAKLEEGGGNEEGDKSEDDKREGDGTFKIANNRAKSQRGSARVHRRVNEEEAQLVNFDNDPALTGGGDGDDEPEEYVFGLDDAKPIRVSRGGGSGTVPPPAASSSSSSGKIASMAAQQTRREKVVATSGSQKVKKMTKDAVKTSRMTSSTGKKKEAVAGGSASGGKQKQRKVIL